MLKAKLNLRPLKVKLIIVALFTCSLLSSQDTKLIRSFDLPFEPVSASIDRQGYLYFASVDGVIEKYSIEGELQYHFSPQKKATPSLLEAWQGLRVFVYYQGFQEYLFLNRFLTDSERYNLDRFDISQFNGLVTLSADNNLWLINSNNLILSKIDLNSGETLLENYLTLSLDSKQIKPAFIKEYQNLLFISDENLGILVFDNLGNYVETLRSPNNGFFSFSKNQMITIRDNKIFLTDIYSKTTREIGTANLSYQIVFMENNQIIALSGKTIKVLNIN